MRSLPPCRPLALLTAALLVTGCIAVPELDQAVPNWVDEAEYPKLIPIGPELLNAPAPREAATEIEQDLTTRAERLRRRAEALRRTRL